MSLTVQINVALTERICQKIGSERVNVTFIVIQSDPLELRPYANTSPFSENAVPLRETVPSSDRRLGSRNTLGSPSTESWTYSTLQSNIDTVQIITSMTLLAM